MRFAIAALISLLLVATISAQDSTQTQAPAFGSPFTFQGGVNLGSDVLIQDGGTTPKTWTRFAFQPDLGFGKIGVGIDLSLHFNLYETADTPFTVYPGDWVRNYQNNGKSLLDVYLPKILYVRYGLKGQDPFFVKLGSINDLSLGNGFIMSDYSNMRFMPQQRIFGLDLGVDGTLFEFPYVGLEVLTGNLARLDVVGTRVYARPLIDTSIPILKNAIVGATVVADSSPYLYYVAGTPPATGQAADKAIAAYGADIVVPILDGKLFPLTAFTDFAVDPNTSLGWMLGFGGRLVQIFTYGAQLRVLQDGFVPAYFDANYDIFRANRLQIQKGSGTYQGWYAALGTSLFSDKFVFNAALDGPFSGKGAVADPSKASQVDYPHLRGILRLDPLDKFPFYFDASYDKYLIGAVKGFFDDLVDPTDAVLGLNLNYKTGASVLTLAYAAKWDPNNQKFNVTSSLQASMKF